MAECRRGYNRPVRSFNDRKIAAMTLLGYSTRTADRLLSRIVPLRWPGDGVRHVAACRMARSVRAAGGPFDVSRCEQQSFETASGYLAVTHGRLLYQPRICLASILRGIATVLVALTAWTVVAGAGPSTALVPGVSGLVLLGTAWLIETGASLPVTAGFDQILAADPDSRRIEILWAEGQRMPEWVRIWVSSPKDFDVVLALAQGRGAEDAA